jgi:predicted small metal-binding protein
MSIIDLEAGSRQEEGKMSYVINCECGATVRAENEDSLVSQVEQHVADAHPELLGKMTRDDILAMSQQG